MSVLCLRDFAVCLFTLTATLFYTTPSSASFFTNIAYYNTELSQGSVDTQHLNIQPDTFTLPEHLLTDKPLTFSWQIIDHAEYYEIWINQKRYTSSAPHFIHTFSQQGHQDIKVRACTASICGGFTNINSVEVLSYFTLDHSARITQSSILRDSEEFSINFKQMNGPLVTKLEARLDENEWLQLDRVNDAYSYNFGPLSTGEYELQLRINNSEIYSESIRAYSTPTTAAKIVGISTKGGKILAHPNIFHAEPNSTLLFHWEESEEVPRTPHGYYRLSINGKGWVDAYGDAFPWIHKLYNYQNFIREFDTGSEFGQLNISIRSCIVGRPVKIIDKDCGPITYTKIKIGLKEESPSIPIFPIEDLSVTKMRVKMEHATKSLDVIAGEPFMLHWERSPEAEGFPRSRYSVSINGQERWALYNLGVATEFYSKDDDLFHKQVVLEKEGTYEFRVKLCNRILFIDDSISFECGQESEPVVVTVKNPYPEVHTHLHERDFATNPIYDTERFLLNVTRTGGAPITDIQARLNGGTWHNLASRNGSYWYDFGYLTKGLYQLELLVNGKLIKAENFSVKLSPVTEPVKSIGLSASANTPTFNGTTFSVSSGEKGYLFWRASDQIPHSPPGYYVITGIGIEPYFIEGNQDVYHFEIPVTQDGIHTLWLKACKQQGTQRKTFTDCGPSTAINLGIGAVDMGLRWQKKNVRVGESVLLKYNNPEIFECNQMNNKSYTVRNNKQGAIEVTFYQAGKDMQLLWDCVDRAGDTIREGRAISPPITIIPLHAPTIHIKQP
ncbi:hypothetical protein OE749_06420 [Aestuariibacter sp. AA17]|uniref:Uncharacterized protein n=1 Tax=Fluctibacter corallii TaxID=2984329 RepID=A0ABT3A6K3_9ALTE|nr:hypothetical protein [Aestuariibacter sp. AA17]MCV2884324.1 hypothetical protein [Aestuariibacter sp. AA17]